MRREGKRQKISNGIGPTSGWAIMGLALSLLVPSLGQVQKYAGTAGTLIYAVFVLAILFAGQRYFLARFLPGATEKQALWIAGGTLAALVVGFSVLYPIANSGVVGGGSDADDALQIAATQILHGRYPYYARTYLGNPIGRLPGSVMLAVPFVLMGNSGYQNLFWLAMLFVALRRYLKDGRKALLLLWVTLVCSPVVLQQLVTGSDLLSNGLYVMLFVLCVATLVPRAEVSVWKKILFAILLGIGLSSRANFVLVLPIVFSSLVRRAGWKVAVGYVGVSCVTFAAVTLPFYLYDPRTFWPSVAEQAGKISEFQSVWPSANVAIPLTAAIIAVALSLRRAEGGSVVLLRDCAVVQAFPVLCGIVLCSIEVKAMEFSFATYGVNFLFFGAVAYWEALVGKPIASTSQRPSGKEPTV